MTWISSTLGQCLVFDPRLYRKAFSHTDIDSFSKWIKKSVESYFVKQFKPLWHFRWFSGGLSNPSSGWKKFSSDWKTNFFLCKAFWVKGQHKFGGGVFDHYKSFHLCRVWPEGPLLFIFSQVHFLYVTLFFDQAQKRSLRDRPYFSIASWLSANQWYFHRFSNSRKKVCATNSETFS